MYKYALLVLLFLMGCSRVEQSAPKTLVCFNPFMPIASYQFELPNSNLKETPKHLIVLTKDNDGNEVYLVIPKSLCVEIIKK